MAIVEHKFKNHPINPDTKILIIGTFNPNSEKNLAHFFYSRSRNNLWKLLPFAFGNESLKQHSKKDKIDYANNKKIGFVDLITSLEVEDGQETNYDDRYLDKKEIKWTDVITLISGLKHLKKVCFTRKTLTDIPKMRERILAIENHCNSLNIKFSFLDTPARFYSTGKSLLTFREGKKVLYL